MPKNEQRWLIRFRCKKTDPLRWATGVGQVAAPKPQDYHADVIANKVVQQSHHPLDWFTQWPPPFDSTDETLHRLLVARGWRTEEGAWLGPAEGRKGKGTGNNAPRHAGGTHVYEELVYGPDTRIGDSPISRLAEQLAVGPIGFDWNAWRSDRMWTNWQAQLRLCKHRLFTTGQARAE